MREVEVLGYVYENGKVVIKPIKLLLGDTSEERQTLMLDAMIKLYLCGALRITSALFVRTMPLI